MDIRLILTDKAYRKDAEQARLFLSVFGLDWRTEVRSIDVANPEIYESKPSSSRKSVTSLRTDWILSLSSERCVGIVCDKARSLQVGLNGQQGTLGMRYALEVYSDSRKGQDGLTGTAATICHEVMHALAEYHSVNDTLHEDLKKGTLTQCREMLLDRILKKDNEWGLLPEVARLAKVLLSEHKIKVLEGYRSPERQDELYKKRPKVTNARGWESMHQYRVAFDYCFTGKEAYPPRGPKWNAVNVHARSLGLYSYGIEENFDDGHLELLFGMTEGRLMSRDVDFRPYWKREEAFVFDRDLRKGSQGEDVRQLQRFLNSRGFTVAESGPGSPGSESDYFGELTRLAVARWQEASGISPAEGYFGPLSRAAI